MSAAPCHCFLTLMLLPAVAVLISFTPVGSLASDERCGAYTPAKGRNPYGFPASADEAPWQVRIEYLDRFCGGVIVSRDWFLTAAHCIEFLLESVQPPNTLPPVFVGTANRSLNDPVAIDKYFFHPRYNNMTRDFNLAMVHFSRNLTFSNTVMPICLLEDCSVERIDGTWCSVSGWSSNKGGSPMLHRGIVGIQNRDACDANLNALSDGTVRLADSMICAGQEIGGKGLFGNCLVDDGGPLGCIGRGNKVYLHGLASFRTGISCESPGTIVFARPCLVMAWIRRVMSGKDAPDSQLITKTSVKTTTTTTTTTRTPATTPTPASTTTTTTTTTPTATSTTTKRPTTTTTTEPSTTRSTTTTTTTRPTTTTTTTTTTTRPPPPPPTTTTTTTTTTRPPPPATTTTTTTTITTARTTTSTAPSSSSGDESEYVEAYSEKSPFAWQVRILPIGDVYPEPGQIPNCNGALIDERWVLTSANCLSKLPSSPSMMVKFNLTDTRYTEGVIRQTVAKTVKHPDYTTDTMDYDFALLKIKDAFDFSRSTVRPIGVLANCGKIATGKECRNPGWQVVDDFDGPLQKKIYSNRLVLAANAEMCKAAFRNPAVFTARKYCAITRNNATIYTQTPNLCQVEYGSPITCVTPGNGRISLYGIASTFPIGCGSPGENYIVSFAAPCTVKDWIQSVIDTSR